MSTSIEEAILKLTNDVDRNPQIIADWFHSWGVSGFKDDQLACPLARWLGSETNLPEIWVDENNVTWEEGGVWHSVRLRPVITEFIIGFDNGLYPELVDVGDVKVNRAAALIRKVLRIQVAAKRGR